MNNSIAALKVIERRDISFDSPDVRAAGSITG